MNIRTKNMLSNIQNLPKIELHCHMDGSMGYEITQELAASIGEVHTLDEIKHLTTASMNCTSLAEYLAKFDIPLKCIKSKEGLKKISYDYVRQASLDNIKYAEMRFAPGSSLAPGLTYNDIFESIEEGLSLGKKEFGIDVGMIVCAMRHVSMDESLEMLKAAKEHMENGVVGCDIAGDEKSHTNYEYKQFFDTAKSYNMPFTIHSGECGNAQNIVEAINLGARRIGHGIAMAGHKDIIDLCVSRKIGVEMCPTSNLQTKAIDSLEHYPFMEFVQSGVCINISTDNRTVSDTTVTKEWELLNSNFELSLDMYEKQFTDSVEMSFACDDIKHKLLKGLHF